MTKGEDSVEKTMNRILMLKRSLVAPKKKARHSSGLSIF